MDRSVNDAEPSVLKQPMNQADAANVIGVLGNGERFWLFLCSNTNAGFFEVFRSEPAFKRQIID